jgi:hypothetical protein
MAARRKENVPADKRIGYDVKYAALISRKIPGKVPMTSGSMLQIRQKASPPGNLMREDKVLVIGGGVFYGRYQALKFGVSPRTCQSGRSSTSLIIGMDFDLYD